MFNLFNERNPVCLGLEQVLEHHTGATTGGPDRSGLRALFWPRFALIHGENSTDSGVTLSLFRLITIHPCIQEHGNTVLQPPLSLCGDCIEDLMSG